MRYDVYMTFMRNMKKVTQLAYVQDVVMIIDLNVNLYFLK